MDDTGSKRPTEHTVTDDGFTRWICPKQGYEMECCDCGLVHALEWRVVQYESDDPESPYSILSDKNIQPHIRLRGVERGGVIASMQADLAASQAALEAVKRERDELSAHVNDLRECVACSLFDIDPDGAQHLGFIVDVEPPYDRSELYELLSKTPQQSLEALKRKERNKVRRECAEICNNGMVVVFGYGAGKYHNKACKTCAEAIEATIEPEE